MKLLVTGSSGLIGSEVVTCFATQGHTVFGVDNNLRADFFGPAGDTRWNEARLKEKFLRFRHLELDIRDRSGVMSCLEAAKPDLVMHTAAQPSHDLAASYDRLAAEASALFGTHHFRDYHFLLALSDQVGFSGLEHHESSDNRAPERTLIDENGRKIVAG